MVPDPKHPVVGVGAVVIWDGRVLLIRRGKDPLRGRWLVPGGTVELGETLEEAVVREVREETGVEVVPREVLVVFDRIDRQEGHVLHHHVIVDYRCDYLGGEPRAGSDAEAIALVAQGDLSDYDLPPKALEVVLEGFRHRGTTHQGLRDRQNGVRSGSYD
jgi:mutator protein MutT